MSGLLDFNWYVNESGYESILLHSTDTDFMNKEIGEMLGINLNMNESPHIRAIDPNSPMRTYNLSDYPTLFREFAQLPIDEDEPMLQFADKYGLLTTVSSTDEPMMSLWIMNSGKMATCIKYLDYIRDRNIEGLKKDFIEEEGVFTVRKTMVNKMSDISSGVKPISESYFSEFRVMGKLPPRNFFDAAYHFICDTIHLRLHNSLSTSLIVNPKQNGVQMHTMPKDLLSALWLQFAYAASRNIEYKQCAACSTFFEVKSKKRHFKKIYCSDRCRKRIAARRKRNERSY